MCPGLPPYDEFVGFSGRVGGHTDSQKKEKWIWACMCFIIMECLGRLKVLAVGATISELTSVFLSLSLSLSLLSLSCLYQDVRQTARTSGSL
jgi:hypothetical protein